MSFFRHSGRPRWLSSFCGIKSKHCIVGTVLLDQVPALRDCLISFPPAGLLCTVVSKTLDVDLPLGGARVLLEDSSRPAIPEDRPRAGRLLSSEKPFLFLLFLLCFYTLFYKYCYFIVNFACLFSHWTTLYQQRPEVSRHLGNNE